METRGSIVEATLKDPSPLISGARETRFLTVVKSKRGRPSTLGMRKGYRAGQKVKRGEARGLFWMAQNPAVSTWPRSRAWPGLHGTRGPGGICSEPPFEKGKGKQETKRVERAIGSRQVTQAGVSGGGKGHAENWLKSGRTGIF